MSTGGIPHPEDMTMEEWAQVALELVQARNQVRRLVRMVQFERAARLAAEAKLARTTGESK